MHVLFALIVYGYLSTSSASAYVTRVGAYGKLSQCEQQGKALTGEAGPFYRYRCIPVNE